MLSPRLRVALLCGAAGTESSPSTDPCSDIETGAACRRAPAPVPVMPLNRLIAAQALPWWGGRVEESALDQAAGTP